MTEETARSLIPGDRVYIGFFKIMPKGAFANIYEATFKRLTSKGCLEFDQMKFRYQPQQCFYNKECALEYVRRLALEAQEDIQEVVENLEMAVANNIL